MQLDVGDVWSPSIYILNTANQEDVIGNAKAMTVMYDGKVRIATPLILNTFCALDLAKFPYDTQNCPVTFFTFQVLTSFIIIASILEIWHGNTLAFHTAQLIPGVNGITLYSVVVAIGIPLRPTTWCAGVKQLWPWFVLGWETVGVVVCQFLLIVLRMRL